MQPYHDNLAGGSRQVLNRIQGSSGETCMTFLDRTQFKGGNGSNSILQIYTCSGCTLPTTAQQSSLHALVHEKIPRGTSTPKTVDGILTCQTKMQDQIWKELSKGRRPLPKQQIIWFQSLQALRSQKTATKLLTTTISVMPLRLPDFESRNVTTAWWWKNVISRRRSR